jgi:hypothetical protein
MKQTTGEIAESVRNQRSLFPGPRRREAAVDLRHGPQERRETDARGRARPGRGNQTIAAQMLGINRNLPAQEIHEHKIKPWNV